MLIFNSPKSSAKCVAPIERLTKVWRSTAHFGFKCLGCNEAKGVCKTLCASSDSFCSYICQCICWFLRYYMSVQTAIGTIHIEDCIQNEAGSVILHQERGPIGSNAISYSCFCFSSIIIYYSGILGGGMQCFDTPCKCISSTLLSPLGMPPKVRCHLHGVLKCLQNWALYPPLGMPLIHQIIT